MSRTSILIFGATGDLSQQKLFPTLCELAQRAVLPPATTIVALGRREWDTEEFRNFTRPHIARVLPEFSPDAIDRFLERVVYYKIDLYEPSAYRKFQKFLYTLEGGVPGKAPDSCPANRLLYVAVAPQLYATVLEGIQAGGIHQANRDCWTRIVLEKPFGRDLVSARKLNALIRSSFAEEQVLRIDHYLAKETVQNLAAFRFANVLFEGVWNRDHIDHIQITVAEDGTIGSRGGYYDATGAFRDFVQNHILQLLTLLTMEEPASFSYDDLADAQMRVLRSLSADPQRTVFGQYRGYRQEEKVDPKSQTETYAMTTFTIDTERWRGVPVYVRTGKALARKVTEITVQFRKPQSRLFQAGQPERMANTISFRIQPDEGIALQLAVKTPREATIVQPVYMEFCYGSIFRSQLPDAYERLLEDFIRGDRTLTLRDDVVEESWRVTDALLDEMAGQSPAVYAPGSWGPEKAEAILAAEGRHWLTHESTYCNGIRIRKT
jgi:glucose-6-phosphate 1-dehydrogenase